MRTYRIQAQVAFQRACTASGLALALLTTSVPTDAACSETSARKSSATTLHYRIASGTLDDALTQFADQSNIQLLYSHSLVRSLRSHGLSGPMEPRAALAQLLAGHRLTAVAINPNTYILQRVTHSSPRPRNPAPKPTADTQDARRPLLGTAPQVLGHVYVTGTRIPRASMEPATPITVITAQEIERSGHGTLFELLRTVPGMWGHHPISVSTQDGQSFQPLGPAAATSLYSLGPRATLFLVDGRRVASYGMVPSDLGSVFDLNGIPLSFIDRIEILRGGASAVYGADAMAGTVNIILKKYGDGVESSVRLGISGRGDAAFARASASIGIPTTGDGHLLVSADIVQRDALDGDRRNWHTADLTRFGLPDGREELGFQDLYGLFPYIPLPRCVATGLDTDSPYCRFDGARHRTLQPELSGASVLAHWNRTIGNNISLQVSGRFSKATQSLQAPPLSGYLSLPTDHPDLDNINPAIRPFFAGAHYAFYELGPMRNRSDADSGDISVALEGNAGNWTWRTDLSHSRSAVDATIDNALVWTRLSEIIPDYRLLHFGNDPALIDAIKARIHPKGKSTLDTLSASLEGPAFTMPSGSARMVAGIEVRRERLLTEPDPLQVSGELSLAASGIAPGEQRQYATSLFLEFNLPLHRRLQLDLASRVDDNAGFERHVSPRVGLKWTPDERLMVRASMGKGYRAPSVHDARNPLLYTTQFPQVTIIDPDPSLLPCIGVPGACVLEYGTGNNPGLRPETSRSQGIGIVWAPSASFNLALDHYRLVRDGEFGVGDPATHPLLFPEGLIRDGNGVLYRANLHLANMGETRANGWELDANYLFRTSTSGSFRARLGAHYLARHVRSDVTAPSERVDHADRDIPRLTALGQLEWSRSGFTTTLDIRHFGGVYAHAAGEDCPASHRNAGKCRNPSATLLNLGIEYAGSERWRLSLNVNNLSDRKPVDYRQGRDGYASGIDDPFGRYYIASATYRF